MLTLGALMLVKGAQRGLQLGAALNCDLCALAVAAVQLFWHRDILAGLGVCCCLFLIYCHKMQMQQMQRQCDSRASSTAKQAAATVCDTERSSMGG